MLESLGGYYIQIQLLPALLLLGACLCSFSAYQIYKGRTMTR